MKKVWQIFWHTLFWLGTIGFFLFITHNNTKIAMNDLLVIFVVYGVVNISLFYFNFLVLLPRYLNRKKYFWFIVTVLLAILVVDLLKYAIALLHKPYILVHDNGKEIGFISYYISTFFTSLVFILLSTVLKFTTDWFNNERVQHDLENQRLSAELAFLKSQINPHFLFNSLNSIYSLAYQGSAATPDAILKLSEIMRYMLYECNDNKVELSKELQYLQNYIDLQKIRFGYKAYVDFEVEGIIGKQQIVPLMLISFIENAFKHGQANDPAQPIRIRMKIEPEKLHFNVVNKKHQFNKDDVGGIGLNNVRRRLDLLYPGKHKLYINNGEDVYTCELSLDL